MAAKQLNLETEYYERNSKEVDLTEVKKTELHRDSRTEFCTVIKDETNKKYKSTLQEVCTVLQIGDRVSEEKIESNLPCYIINAEHLKKNETEKMVDLINQLAQNKQDYSKELRQEAIKLHKDLDKASKQTKA